MLIDDLARACDLNIATVQAYQRAGLLPQPHTDRHGQIHYPAKTSTTRVRFLRDAQAVGLDLDDLAALFLTRDHGTLPDDGLLARLDEDLRRLHQQIHQLRQVETELRRLTAALADRTPSGDTPPSLDRSR